jgi:hypothetical protein
MRRSCVSLLVGVVVALLALAACGPNSTTSSSDASPPSGTPTGPARTAVCAGITTVNQALASLSSVDVNTTVGQVKSAQQKVTKALNAIEPQIPSDSGTVFSQVKQANDQLAAAIKDYPDETPIGQTSAKIQDLQTTVANAQSKTERLASRLHCAP